MNDPLKMVHRSTGKSDHSMQDLHDVAKMGYVIENYDKIVEGDSNHEYKNKDNSYSKNVILQKKIDDNYFYVVEAVPDTARKALHVVSAYINKNDTFPVVSDAKSLNSDVRNELQSNMSSTNSIPQKKQKTTENQKKSLGEDTLIGNWNIKGEDISLEDIPIRQDVAPAQKQEVQQVQSEEWNPEVSDDLEIGPFSPSNSNQDTQVSSAEEFKNSSVKA